jgi:DNA-binding NarL/FixJ family response regulator
MESKIFVLILVKPDRKRESLRVLLRGMSRLELVGEAHDAASAWQLITAHNPEVLVLDFELLESEALALLERVEHDYPQLRCLALVSNSRQAEAAMQAGADETLLAGFSITTLWAAVELSDELTEDMLDGITGGAGGSPMTLDNLIRGDFIGHPGEFDKT